MFHTSVVSGYLKYFGVLMGTKINPTQHLLRCFKDHTRNVEPLKAILKFKAGYRLTKQNLNNLLKISKYQAKISVSQLYE